MYYDDERDYQQEDRSGKKKKRRGQKGEIGPDGKEKDCAIF